VCLGATKHGKQRRASRRNGVGRQRSFIEHAVDSPRKRGPGLPCEQSVNNFAPNTTQHRPPTRARATKNRESRHLHYAVNREGCWFGSSLRSQSSERYTCWKRPAEEMTGRFPAIGSVARPGPGQADARPSCDLGSGVWTPCDEILAASRSVHQDRLGGLNRRLHHGPTMDPQRGQLATRCNHVISGSN
jgi:hypothetical protein